MEKVFIKSEFITLGQFAKFVNLVGTGSESKSFILEKDISVNGKIEKRRGRKLREKDIISINGENYIICLSKS